MYEIRTELPEMLSPKQVADLLQVTERTVYNWLHQGILDGRKFGGTWRIRASSLTEPASENKAYKT